MFLLVVWLSAMSAMALDTATIDPTRFQIGNYREFQASSPIGMCPTESILVLDEWTLRKECKNKFIAPQVKRRSHKACKNDLEFMVPVSKVDEAAKEAARKRFQEKHDAEFAEFQRKKREQEELANKELKSDL